MDPDPGGPKTCGSGSGTLVLRIWITSEGTVLNVRVADPHHF
jgi:hypothetical protein